MQAAVAKGDLRTLAEPNLLTLPAKEAYFLAGGEFPYPTVQSGSSNAMTITFKEFGVKLRFTPQIARNGAIRLKVAPEVSTLDFANGVTISGFEIPSLRTRRAETEVELREGQHLAIAGLLDNESTRNLTKIPILGDIPILGEFFKSKQTAPAPDRARRDRDALAGHGQRHRSADPDGRAGRHAVPQGLGLGRKSEDAREVSATTRFRTTVVRPRGERGTGGSMRGLWHGRRSERGSTIAIMAVMLFAMLAMAAFAIDLASLRSARSEAQRAADAIALAGASAFHDLPSGDATATDDGARRGPWTSRG